VAAIADGLGVVSLVLAHDSGLAATLFLVGAVLALCSLLGLAHIEKGLTVVEAHT
jgi:hypothetical protein